MQLRATGDERAKRAERNWPPLSLGDATRRDIVRRTLAGEATVSELAASYEMSSAAAQKHVAVLEGAGPVMKRPRGRERIVRGNADKVCCVDGDSQVRRLLR
jgi:DNA-binding transcriptional ArsR family regulator